MMGYKVMGSGVPGLTVQAICMDATTAITAAGTTQGTATQLTAAVNFIGTTAAGTGVILYSAATLGDTQYVYNGGANNLLVYPPSGAAINGGTTNAAITVTPNTSVICQCGSATAWASVPAVSSGALNTQTASSSATLDITTGFSSAYESYTFDLINIIPETDDVGLYMRVYVAGVAQSGVADYGWTSHGNAGGSNIDLADASDSEIEIVPAVLAGGNAIGNGANEGLNGTVKLWAPSGTVVNKRFTFDVSFAAAGGENSGLNGSGAYIGSTAAITGVQFLMESGDIASGTIRMYGVPK
jgi:hypothetical protein